jgi:hypothetical protein
MRYPTSHIDAVLPALECGFGVLSGLCQGEIALSIPEVAEDGFYFPHIHCVLFGENQERIRRGALSMRKNRESAH